MRLIPGIDKEKKEQPHASDENIGKEEKFVTLKHNYDSPQTNPTWEDDERVRINNCSGIVVFLL